MNNGIQRTPMGLPPSICLCRWCSGRCLRRPFASPPPPRLSDPCSFLQRCGRRTQSQTHATPRHTNTYIIHHTSYVIHICTKQMNATIVHTQHIYGIQRHTDAYTYQIHTVVTILYRHCIFTFLSYAYCTHTATSHCFSVQH